METCQSLWPGSQTYTRNTRKWKMPRGMYYTSNLHIDNIPMHFAAGMCLVTVIRILVKSTQFKGKTFMTTSYSNNILKACWVSLRILLSCVQ